MPTRSSKQRSSPPRLLPRGRNRLSPDEVLLRQRERLLQAMRQALAKGGFRATSVSQIATQAHVTRPVFYRVFPGGKDECFLAAYDEAVGELMQIAETTYTKTAPGLAGMEAALRAVLMRLAQAPEMARLCLIEITALGEVGLRHRDAVLHRIAEQLQTLLSQSEGSSSASPQKIRALVGGGYQLLHLTVAEGRTGELPALAPDILYMILAYQLGPRPPRQPV